MTDQTPAAPAPDSPSFRRQLYAQLVFGMSFISLLILFVAVGPGELTLALAHMPFTVMAIIFIGCRVTKYPLVSYEMMASYIQAIGLCMLFFLVLARVVGNGDLDKDVQGYAAAASLALTAIAAWLAAGAARHLAWPGYRLMGR